MKRISLYVFTSLLLLLQSCIREEGRSDCESMLLLRFRYVLNNQNTNLFDAEVQRVTVYVFDEEGKYVDRFSEQGDQLTNDYVMRLVLPEGHYSVVVHGGDLTAYTIGEFDKETLLLNSVLQKGITDINDFRAELKHITGDGGFLYPELSPDALYSGFAHAVYAKPGNADVTDVELIRLTRKIKVRVVNEAARVLPYDVYMIAQNGRYGFDNRLDVSLGTLKYMPVNFSVSGNAMEFDLRVMRLVLGQNPVLVVRDPATSEVVYNENVIEQILKTGKYVTQSDLDREDEFVFEITIPSGSQQIGISVSINGWKISNITPGI